MMVRSTITIDKENLIFLEEHAKNKSAYINLLLTREKERCMKELMLKANQEEASDISYQKDFKNDPNNKGKIGVQGTAPSRETLLLFRKALEDDVNFKNVNLPISNFVKGSDIKFYLSLIPS